MYSSFKNLATIERIIFPVFLIAVLIVFNSCRDSNGSATESVRTSNAGERPRPLSNLEVTRISIKIGDGPGVSLERSGAKPEDSVFYLNLHDNENTSVDAALQTIGKYGGTLLEIRHSGERLVSFSIGEEQFQFDPNRMFSRSGIANDLIKHGRDSEKAREAVDQFAQRIVSDYIEPNSKLIVTVHNNTNDGGLTVNSYKANEAATKKVFISPDQDVDDFFIVTRDDYFESLKALGFSVVLQDNEKIKSDQALDDGSLSVFCGRTGIPYINVESEHGHLDQQIKMLEALYQILAEKS